MTKNQEIERKIGTNGQNMAKNKKNMSGTNDKIGQKMAKNQNS